MLKTHTMPGDDGGKRRAREKSTTGSRTPASSVAKKSTKKSTPAKVDEKPSRQSSPARAAATKKSGGTAVEKSQPRGQANNVKAEDLLGRIIEIVRAQGLAGFSLDNLAAQLGTSSRMLVYYFGSKDELLGRIVYTLRDDIVTLLEDEPVVAITDAIDRWWNHYIDNPADMQFFFHLTSRSFEEPDKFQEFSSTAVGQWAHYFRRSLADQVASDAEAETIARLVLATLRGLSGDLLITADKREVGKSLQAFKDLLHSRLGG